MLCFSLSYTQTLQSLSIKFPVNLAQLVNLSFDSLFAIDSNRIKWFLTDTVSHSLASYPCDYQSSTEENLKRRKNNNVHDSNVPPHIR